MLTTVELPGINVRPVSGLLCVFDPFDVQREEADDETLVLCCRMEVQKQ
jgi:hypothetical protein